MIDTMELPFLGRGWSFPPEFDRSPPGVKMVAQEDDVASSLAILLTTMRGERIMLPLYGCGLQELLFESLDTRMKTLMIDKIETAVLYHEPRITLVSVRLDDSAELEGVVLIDIVFQLRSTNSRFNFVYPFYKLEGTDINLMSTLTLLPDAA